MAAADLDGTLLVSRSSFPYFFLVAVEAGSYLRGLALLLLAPVILALYVAVSEPAAIELLIFASMAGLRARDVEAAARAVLPRFYAADVRAEAWEAFRACGGRRRLVVTANPRVMVEGFVGEWLGAEVVGTEIEVERRTGRCTGRVRPPGVLVGDKKRVALQKVLGPGVRPDLGLGDRDSDHDFMAICKVPTHIDFLSSYFSIYHYEIQFIFAWIINESNTSKLISIRIWLIKISIRIYLLIDDDFELISSRI